MSTALIIGCGYVGAELAQQLVAAGEQVIAVSRRGVATEGVESLERDVTDPGLTLPDADRVFYLVSPDERSAAAYRASYVDGLANTVAALGDGRSGLVYSSSTGVYETDDGSWVDEETPIEPTTERARILLEAERIAFDAGGTVVRFGGLYGPGRVGIDRYLDDATVPSGYLNLVHRVDAATALPVAAVGDHDRYLAVDDQPVDRHQLARWLAARTGRSVGELVDEGRGSNKRCSNTRLRDEGWSLAYPTYREGYAAVLADGDEA